MLPEREGAARGQNEGDRGGGEDTCETVPRQVCVHGDHSTVSLWVQGTCLQLCKHQKVLTQPKSPKRQKANKQTTLFMKTQIPLYLETTKTQRRHLNDSPSSLGETSVELITSVLPTHAAGPLQVPAWQPLVTSCKAQTLTSYPSAPLATVLSGSPTIPAPTNGEA